MHLIFIRHADPDYKNDSLTEKGFKEAEFLSERVKNWGNVEKLFSSPYGRALETAKAVSKGINKSVTILPYLKEFDHRICHPETKKVRGCWDWLPSDLKDTPELYDKNLWLKTDAMQSGNISLHYKTLCENFDETLSEYGYKRISPNDNVDPVGIYNCTAHISEEEAKTDTHLLPFQKDIDAKTLVFVCHLGSMFCCISHLLGISPVVLWQGFFVAPSSVTVLSSQERVPGEAVFRVQTLGNVNHLSKNGETPSASGFFGNFTDF